MAKHLTFSVGIPTFNQADFLEETILSLLNQTRPPDEIVISDHFSTDRTPDIIAKYSGQVRGLKPPPGSNVGAQWDFTLSSLTGDWVTLFSSDDIAHPNFVEVLLRGAQRHDDAVLVRAGWENIDKTGAVVSKEYLLSVKSVTTPPDTLFEQKHGPKASFAAFAVKRDILQASGGYPTDMESFGDWPMFMQLAPFGSFIYENEIISGYRIGYEGNKFRKRASMWIRDEQRMFYEVMPLAADRANLTDRAWIDQASRANFIRYLSAASDEFPLSERAELVPVFDSWATRVDGQALLAAFAAGGTIKQPTTLLQRGKNLIRPYAQRFNDRLRRQ
jgi:glycosyltransferase involved in cell wall biosynthesis